MPLHITALLKKSADTYARLFTGCSREHASRILLAIGLGHRARCLTLLRAPLRSKWSQPVHMVQPKLQSIRRHEMQDWRRAPHP